MSTPLRIAIVVPGRFHAFDLARELARQGQDVRVFTSHPASRAVRFGVSADRVRSAWVHAAVEQGLQRVPFGMAGRTEEWRRAAFGRWSASALEGTDWDVIHCWSGVSEELLRSPRVRAAARVLMRGSAHIAEQDRLLREEETRVGVPLDRPRPGMIAREMREYEAADRVLVLSSYARDSFVRMGYDPARLAVLPLGVDVSAFRAPATAVQARAQRIRDGRPLKVLYAGTLSARKGLLDLIAVARACAGEAIEFVLVGPRLAETAGLLAGAGPNVVVLDGKPQAELPAVYRDADLFLFPTIEDGFGMVLTQARAAGLPILCTRHCAGPDLIAEGRDGWVLPIRATEAFAGRLRWCASHREDLAAMTAAVAGGQPPRDWSAVAQDFVDLAGEWIAERAGSARGR